MARCDECGTEFHCGRHDANPCWCARDFPPIPVSPEAGRSCLCPHCLQARLDRHMRAPGASHLDRD